MSSEPPLTPRQTADGSYTFFSHTFGECFHSHYGAHQEAVGKFVQPTRIAELAQHPHLRLLDICYGLGYNSAAALAAIWQINPDCQVELIALEADPAVPKAAIDHGFLQGWSPDLQDKLAQLAQRHQVTTDHFQAQLLLGDARQSIQRLVAQHFQAEAIFLDPFSPPHCPQLWTIEFLTQVYHCLTGQGRLATYSCAAAVRTGLQAAGFAIGASPPIGRRTSGTIASHTLLQDWPLSLREREHLRTRAAVPYRDPTLSDPASLIWARRRQEQQDSPLQPIQQWKKRWQQIEAH